MLKLYQKRIRRFDKNSFVFENPLDFDNPYGYRVFSHWFNQVLRKAILDMRSEHTGQRGYAFMRYDTTSHLILFRNLKKKDAAFMIPHHFCRTTGHSNFVATTEYITDDYMMYTVSHERMNDGIGSLFPEVSFK